MERLGHLSGVVGGGDGGLGLPVLGAGRQLRLPGAPLRQRLVQSVPLRLGAGGGASGASGQVVVVVVVARW